MINEIGMNKITLYAELAHHRVMHEMEIQDESDMYDGENYKEDVQDMFNEFCDYYSDVVDKIIK